MIGKDEAFAMSKLEDLCVEVRHLRRQRDELQAANTREVQARRVAELQFEQIRQNSLIRERHFEVTFGTRYPERLESFVLHMAVKLIDNAHKGDWRKLSCQELLDGLRGEVRELEEAFDKSHGEIVAECVDVANYAMMLADVTLERFVRPTWF